MAAEYAKESLRGLGYGFGAEAAFFKGLFAPLMADRRAYREALVRLHYVPATPRCANPLIYMFNKPTFLRQG